MKIALVTSTFLPKIGGAQLVVHNLASQWCSQGHEVCVMMEMFKDHLPIETTYSVKSYRVFRGSYRFGPHHFPFWYFNAKSIKRQLDAFNPDFISAHFGYPVGVWLSKIQPLPRFLVTCHGKDLTTAEWGYRRQYQSDSTMAAALNKSIRAVAISSYARQQMENIGINQEKIVDIPNGVNVLRFQKNVREGIRGKFGIPSDSILILSVGRNSKDKDYMTAIKAFARICETETKTYYLIVGENTDKLLPLICELNLSRRVILCPGLYKDELVGAYQESDIFFSSSVTELCPLVVLEALATGLPQVVTNVSGSQDIIQTGVNGFVVEPSQPDEMACALRKLIDDEILRNRMGEVNLRRAKSYSWDNISRMYLEYS